MPEDELSVDVDWRAALASIGDAVVTSDRSGRVTLLNPAAERLTGWRERDAVGEDLERVVRLVDESTRRVKSPATRALREGVIVGLENHGLLIAADGSETQIDDTAAPILNESGEVAGVVQVFRDITRHRQSEDVVARARDYAEHVIATLREPFLVLDKDLRVLSANAAFYDCFKVLRTDTEGSFVYDLGNRQWDRPGLRTMLGETLISDHPFDNFEVEHVFPSIGKRTMLLNARRVKSWAGGPDLILLAIEDRTHRRQARRILETSEVRYRRLFETAQDGILILDAGTGRILDANPFMTLLLGYEHDEFTEKELWEIGLFSDRSANEAMFRELQQYEFVRYDHLPLQTRAGQRRDVEFVSNVYLVDQRRVAQCNIRDISERTRLERQTKALAEALANLHRRKDEFLAMLAHELRNPLAPISNAVGLLRLQGDETPLQRQARGIIERQLGQLSHLVDDLLEVARVTTGRIHVNQEHISLNGIVENAVETARPVLDRYKHNLTVSVPKHTVWMYADGARLEQVLVNLLNNAAKFTNEGGQVWLTLSEEGNEAVLRVRDTGVGISASELPRVFDIFSQAERSLDRSAGGLGIGLALVHRLIEMHGGTVEAHSSLGNGSEFVVRLPTMMIGTRHDAAPQLELESLHAADPPLKVLVVDDSSDAVESLTALLRAAGHDVLSANSGQAALEAAIEHTPHVILLDIGLPGLNGFEVAYRLKQRPALESVVLVATTGYGQETDKEGTKEAGFDYHLVKPFSFSAVQRILADVAQKPAFGFSAEAARPRAGAT